MSIITPEQRKANQGKFIKAKDLVNSPIRLVIEKSETEESIFKNDKGVYPTLNVFYFHDEENNEKQISVGLSSSLFREIDKIDPDEGDLLEIWTEMVEGNDYPVWHVKAIEKNQKKTVDKPVDNQEINIEDLGF